jgi:hypothetical protein
MKDMKAREIYADMNNTLGADCIGCSTVTKYLREKFLEVDALHGFRTEN